MQSQPVEQVGFLEEAPGKHSSMRLMCMISLFAAIGFGAVTVQRDLKGDGLFITYGFLIGAFAPKAVQKFAEAQFSAYGAPPPTVAVAPQPVAAYPTTMMVATPTSAPVAPPTPPAAVPNQDVLTRLQARGR